jgi:hypothetical protein
MAQHRESLIFPPAAPGATQADRIAILAAANEVARRASRPPRRPPVPHGQGLFPATTPDEAHVRHHALMERVGQQQDAAGLKWIQAIADTSAFHNTLHAAHMRAARHGATAADRAQAQDAQHRYNALRSREQELYRQFLGHRVLPRVTDEQAWGPHTVGVPNEERYSRAYTRLDRAATSIARFVRPRMTNQRMNRGVGLAMLARAEVTHTPRGPHDRPTSTPLPASAVHLIGQHLRGKGGARWRRPPQPRR